MSSYREHAPDGASAVDLVVALYDGILRFLNIATAAAERGDASGRRDAVRGALDIIIHLQARLRMDVGGRPAQALSEFYASIFAQILQASQSASRSKFKHAIGSVRIVRDAWREVARDPNVSPAPVRLPGTARRVPPADSDGCDRTPAWEPGRTATPEFEASGHA